MRHYKMLLIAFFPLKSTGIYYKLLLLRSIKKNKTAQVGVCPLLMSILHLA